ncbi:MAG: cyclic pyranopterin monophosphate synthase MoaC [Thermoprotei archaeon]|nr:MAG: cyclic pyranopterin monophosphate synthase MoaC [Thermoprotei archaeon]
MCVKMVDISSKEVTYREAIAEGRIRLRPSTLELIKKGQVEKGDVISVAKIAAILAAKKTSELVPLCHPIPITSVDTDIEIREETCEVVVRCRVKAIAKTGVEMEALVATAMALIAIWDMVKKYEKDESGQYPYTEITSIRVLEKQKKFMNVQNTA